MAINVKNILSIVNKKLETFGESEVSEEEKTIADNIIEILNAYCVDEIEVGEVLELDERK